MDNKNKSIVYLKKSVFFILVFALVFVLPLDFASALNSNFTNVTGSIERALSTISTTNLVNFTIGAESENITQVVFTITGSQNTDPDNFIIDSNGTTSLNSSFMNLSSTNWGMPGASYTLILTFTNITRAGIIPNGTTKSFWFNIHSRSMATSQLTVMANATGISGTSNATNSLSWPFTFRFSGYVRNESGGLQNSTNVSIYQFQEGQNGPPTETIRGSTLTNENGSFTLSGLSSAGGVNYKLKMIYYNTTGSATKIGTILPDFPAEMYYPPSFSGAYDFMRPSSLNGTTYYLGPAATINVSATNNSLAQRFGYMIMEQGTGFPLESNSMTNVTNVQIVVPVGRTYTLMLLRAHSQFAQRAVCDGAYMNDSSCPTPPKSNSTLSPNVAGQILNVIMDLRITRNEMYGCIGVAGNSTPITNISLILPKMMPWTGFVPPARADTQDMNLSNPAQLNYSDARCTGKIALYNISVLNADYFLEFYGRNDTGSRNGEFVAALQNASFTSGNKNINITLLPLAGSFSQASAFEVSQGTAVNTTKFAIRVQNASGAAITNDKPHIEVTLKNSSVFGQITYVAEATNGSFSLTIPRGLTGKVKVFSNNAPPKEKALNLSNTELNITLINMQGGDGGFRRINSSGGLQEMNISDQTNFDILMRFIKNSESCNIINPDADTCLLTSMDADSFNPLKALVAGRINMEMKLKSSNVSITFYNFDMFSAKQPPMESIMDNQAASGASSANQIWQFGSFVPAEVYDYAVIAMPYSDSIIDDSENINTSIPVLYDENWQPVWNYSRGDRTENLSSSIDDYLGNNNNRSYNSSGYRNLINGEVICNNTDSNISAPTPGVYCHVNTSSNMIYVRIPHFSGIGPTIAGRTVSSPSTNSNGGSGSGGGGGGGGLITYAVSTEQFTTGYSKELIRGERVRFSIDDEEHTVSVENVTTDRVIIVVNSTPQTATLIVGETKKFNVDNDQYFDLSIKLNSISVNKANITLSRLHEPISQENTSSEKVNENTSSQESGKSLKENLLRFAPILGVLVIVTIVAIIFYFKRKKSV